MGTTAATIDHEVASGLSPELAVLLNESQAKLASLSVEVFNPTQPDAPSAPRRHRSASNEEDEDGEDFTSYTPQKVDAACSMYVCILCDCSHVNRS